MREPLRKNEKYRKGSRARQNPVTGTPEGAAEVWSAAAGKVKNRPLKGSQEASADLLTNVFGFEAIGSQVKIRGVSGRRGPDTGSANSALKLALKARR